ncbi:MAG: DNA polymerase IV [Rubricoccaceae bacterium]|nr:DNA polymerase IV [Rubricoccaceae bacterium]
MRRILHIDLDAFFASVEQRDNPDLKGKPVVVGGVERGVVAAASYEARTYGIHSAMPMKTAMKRCRELVVVKPRFDAYREASDHVRDIFERYTDIIEPISIDEAYLDVTACVDEQKTATDIAEAIRNAIREELALTASAGVSFNKFLAKLASDYNKPDGLTIIRPDNAAAFLAALPIEQFRGVGVKTAPRLRELGITNGASLLAWEKEELERRFGKFGRALYRMARGDDNRPVQTHRERKSIGAERTFFEDLTTQEEMQAALEPLVERVSRYMRKRNFRARTVTLKIKSSSFVIKTRSITLPEPIHTEAELLANALDLLNRHLPNYPVRLLGVTASNLVSSEPEAGEQLGLGLSRSDASVPQ